MIGNKTAHFDIQRTTSRLTEILCLFDASIPKYSTCFPIVERRLQKLKARNLFLQYVLILGMQNNNQI